MKSLMTMKLARPACTLLLAALLGAPVHAGIVQTDGNVPLLMDTGGTAEDPARYIIGDTGAYAWGNSGQSPKIGENASYNHLVVQNGSTVTTFGAYVGYGGSSDFNSLTITGGGSGWSGSQISVGSSGSNNTLVVENGAFMSIGLTSVVIGANAGADNNSVIVRGTGSTWVSALGIDVGSEGANGSFRVENGASVTVGNYFAVGWGDSGNAALGSGNSAVITGTGSTLTTGTGQDSLEIGHFSSGSSLLISEGGALYSGGAYIGYGRNVNPAMGSGNEVLVTGSGSLWSSSGNLVVGEYGSGNSLTIRDGALVKVDGLFSISTNGGTDNFLKIDDGFFAWKGNHVTGLDEMIDSGLFRIWDGSTWVTASVDDLSFLYFGSDLSAFDYTGYEGLGGYTILSTVMIPEPGTLGMLGGVALLGFASVYRRRRKDDTRQGYGVCSRD